MPKIRSIFFASVMLVASLICITALADPTPVVPPDPGFDPGNTQGALSAFWGAVVSHRYGLASAIGTMLFVAFVRFIAPRIHGRFGDWIHGDRVSAALALLSGMFAAITSQLIKGGPWSMNILAYGFAAGVAAIGGYNAFWDIIFPADKSRIFPSKASTMSTSAAEAARRGPPSSTVLVLIFVAVFGVAMPGCPATTQCADVAHKNDPVCRALDVVVTCGPTSALDALEAIVVGVVPAIIGKTINWDAIVDLERQYGTDAVMCVLNNLFHIAISDGSALAQQHPNIAQPIAEVAANRENVKKNVGTIFAQRHVVIREAGQ